MLFLGSLLVLAPAWVCAQPGASADENEVRLAEARRRFELGISHFDRQEWQAALVEFLRSRKLAPTRANTKNAAICLRKVGRFDEALDLFEALLREFPDLSVADQERAHREISELGESVGMIEIQGAPAGASVNINGVDRGLTPLSAPVRLPSGTHTVRVIKMGSLPFETRVDLAGREALAVKVELVTLTHGERLRAEGHEPSSQTLARPSREKRPMSVELDPFARRSGIEIEFDAGTPVPLLWGGLGDGCVAPCLAQPHIGLYALVHASYRFAGGAGLGFHAGYLQMGTAFWGRPESLSLANGSPYSGTADDSLRLAGLTAGAEVDYVTGKTWQLSLRLSVGTLIGSVTDWRAVTLLAGGGVTTRQEARASYLYLGPEVRAGYRMGEHVQVSLGAKLTLFASVVRPFWDSSSLIHVEDLDGGAFLPGESMTGEFMAAVLPGAALNYSF